MREYKVYWLATWLTLCRYAAIVMGVSMPLILVASYVGSALGFSEPPKASLLEGIGIVLLVALGGTVVLSLLLLPVVLLLRVYKVGIQNGTLHGRSYWTLRRRAIPLHEVTSLRPFNGGAVAGFFVGSEEHGGIFFPAQIEDVAYLLALIGDYMAARSALE